MDGFLLRLIGEMKERPFLWDRNHEHFGCRFLHESGWEEVGKALKRDKTYVKRRWKNLSDTFKKDLKNLKVINGKVVYTGCWRLFDAMSFARDYFLQNIKARQKHRTLVQNLNELSTNSSQDSFMNHVETTNSEEKIKNQEEENAPHVVEQSKDSTVKEFEYILVKEESEEQDNNDKNISTISEDADQNIVGEILSTNDKYFIAEEVLNSQEKTSKRKASVTLGDSANHEIKKPRKATLTSTDDVDDDVHFVMSLVPYLRKLKPLRKLLIRNEIQSLLIKELLCDNCKVGEISNCIGNEDK